MFYRIKVHHWLYDNEEKVFDYNRQGKRNLEKYMWEKINAGWSVIKLEIRKTNNEYDK